MKLTPWRHQSEEYEEHWSDPARAMLWDMRTGKTKVIIDKAFRLYRAGKIKGLLILAPNGVHRNWTRIELPKHAWDDDWRGVSWSSWLSHQRNSAFESQVAGVLERRRGLRVLTVNSETLILERVQRLIKEFLNACDDQVMVDFDESHSFRRPGSRRTGLARGLAKRIAYRRITTGTAILNSPLHAFSQFELLEKAALGFSKFADFKERYAVYVQDRLKWSGRTYMRLDHYINVDELRERMARLSSVVLRGEVDDMPELVPVSVTVEMSEKQRRAYLKMVTELLVDLEGGGEVVAEHGGAKFIKLHQIVGGFVIDKKGDVHSIDDAPPILDAMEDQVFGTLPGKSIIWCRFQEDIRRVCRRLRERGIGFVEYHGLVPDRLRDEAIDRFMNDDRVTGFVGQPQSGGQGLNLSAADAVIWYSSTPDAIIKRQADERATLVGGRSVALVTLETPGTVHDDIVNSNEGKVKLADAVSGRGLRDLLLRTRV